MIATDIFYNIKMRCIFPMAISSEFHMEQYKDEDHREDVSHFSSNF